MQMNLKAIILWPKNASFKPKLVPFEAGVINVITGQSRSGKSSLIHIVDYCLGSGKCSIPVGVIRDSVEWYGVLLQLANTQFLVARRNPDEQIQSGDIYLVEATTIDPLAHKPKKNGVVDYLKHKLNDLSGLPNLPTDPTSSSGFKGPPSFRDLAAFTFQPQHIVANPHTLFFKTDTFEHREKLQAIFPVVLGALNAEQLVAKYQLHQLQIELDRKKQMLSRQSDAVNAWVSQIRAFVTKGKELGLISDQVQVPQSANAQQLLEVLRGVPRQLEAGIFPKVDVGAADEAISRVRELEEQEDELAKKLSNASRRKLQIERLRSSVATYGVQLANEREKLAGIDWLAKRLDHTENCPLCGQDSHAGHEALNKLIELSRQMSQLTTSTTSATPALDKESTRLEAENRDLEAQLETVREERWGLEDKSVELAERRRTEVEAFRLSGRIEQALELYATTDVDSALVKTVAGLERDVENLKRVVNPALERTRLSGALQRFTQLASRYTEPLKLERGNDPVELDVKELMVLILQSSSRKDALWEIGSAENWLGYHIATLLALHELFLLHTNSAVPTFLMIDQPSQAYFPDTWPEDEEGGEKLLAGKSEDIAGVHRIFETLALAIKRCQGKLQIIVTDHAGNITWDGVESINLIGNWREGKDEFLIPKEWVTALVTVNAPTI